MTGSQEGSEFLSDKKPVQQLQRSRLTGALAAFWMTDAAPPPFLYLFHKDGPCCPKWFWTLFKILGANVLTVL